jgi:hypothetical protein
LRLGRRSETEDAVVYSFGIDMVYNVNMVNLVYGIDGREDGRWEMEKSV